MAMLPDLNLDAQAVNNLAVRWRYTEGCTIDVSGPGVPNLQWANGNAIAATTGGSIGYIPRHMHISMNNDGTAYHWKTDFNQIIGGGVSQKAAFIIVMARKTILGLNEIALSVSEQSRTPNDNVDLAFDNELKAMLAQGSQVVNSLLQQTLTIVALNGVSMLSTGHHYSPNDAAWKAFERATNYSAMLDSVGIAEDRGLFYHDLAHPVDINYLVGLVTLRTDQLIGHIQGVALIRLGGMPAGTSLVNVGLGFASELMTLVPKIVDMLSAIYKLLSALKARIMQSPLSFCSQFQRANTAQNLAIIGEFDKYTIFMAGIYEGADLPKSSLLRSKALINAKKQNVALYQQGRIVGISNKISEEDQEALAIQSTNSIRTEVITATARIEELRN